MKFIIWILTVIPRWKKTHNDIYPINKYLHLLEMRTPSGHVIGLNNWILTPNGQEVIEQTGLISLWDLLY